MTLMMKVSRLNSKASEACANQLSRQGGTAPGFVSLLVTGSLHLCLGTMSQLKQGAEEDWEGGSLIQF